MATVASGIDETNNVVQLNGFLGKDFIFIICFLKVQLYLCIYLICVFICQSPVNLRFIISLFFSAESFSRI